MVASNKRTAIGRQAPDETESTAGIKPGVSPGSHRTLISVGFRSHSRRQTARARCRRRARPREGSPAARTTMRRYWISGPRCGRPGQAAGSCLPSALRATTARGDSAPTSFLTVLGPWGCPECSPQAASDARDAGLDALTSQAVGVPGVSVQRAAVAEEDSDARARWPDPEVQLRLGRESERDFPSADPHSNSGMRAGPHRSPARPPRPSP